MTIFTRPPAKSDRLTANAILKSLERILGLPRHEWNVALLRNLWVSLNERITGRKLSVEHEEAWLTLSGFLLRPGFGCARDELRMDELERLLSPATRLVAVGHVSNALGTITPVRQIIEMAHFAGALALIDGAQAVAHMPVNVAELDPDFYIFSGHKIFGPTGIGALYGKSAVLESMPPWQGGGNMITKVALDRSEFQHPPSRFEAGTNSIADAVGLGTALDYVQRLGLPNIARYEHELLTYATNAMQTVPGLRLIGTAPHKASVLSFVLDGYRPEEVGSALNREGIAVRAGHHCAQPILRHYGLEATVRPSLAFYNTCEEVDLLVTTLRRLATYAGRR